MEKRIVSMAIALVWLLTASAQVSSLQGKRMGVIGDSYVKNHREPVENTWHYKFARQNGMEYYNYGRNGNCVSIDRARWGEAMWKRYTTMRDSLDIIVIIAGHNDAALLDSMGIETYKEKCEVLCRGLIERYPKASLFWFTPWSHDDPHFLEVVDATKEVCGSLGIPVFDAYRNSNIYTRIDSFRDIYFQGGRRDHAHLNGRGHDRFLPIAAHFIQSYFK